MIVAKSPGPGDHIVVKLTTGDDILGKIQDLTSEDITISRPRVLMSTAQGVGLAPYMMFADDDVVKLKRIHIIDFRKMKKEMESEYIQATSGLVMGANANMSKLKI